MHINHVEFTGGAVWRIENNIPNLCGQGFYDLLQQYIKTVPNTDEPTPEGFCKWVCAKLGTGVTCRPEKGSNGHNMISKHSLLSPAKRAWRSAVMRG